MIKFIFQSAFSCKASSHFGQFWLFCYLKFFNKVAYVHLNKETREMHSLLLSKKVSLCWSNHIVVISRLHKKTRQWRKPTVAQEEGERGARADQHRHAAAGSGQQPAHSAVRHTDAGRAPLARDAHARPARTVAPGGQ